MHRSGEKGSSPLLTRSRRARCAATTPISRSGSSSAPCIRRAALET